MDERTLGVIGAATTYVQQHMSRLDASHDYDHVTRVLALAKLIFQNENDVLSRPTTVPRSDRNDGEPVPSMRLSEPVVVLGALLHDVNDSKYLGPSECPIHLADLLTRWGANSELALRVERLCQGVSYSTEIRDPQLVRDLIREIPELAVVQDADRLDSLGAIGVGRCFTFGASRRRGMSDSVQHFEEKLLHLESMMKTRTGGQMAKVRTERIKEFMRWWDDESQTAAGVVSF